MSDRVSNEGRRGALVRDAAWILGWFVAAGAIAAVAWWQLAQPAHFTRTAQGAAMDQIELAKQFGNEGWYAATGAVAALVSGIGLMAWRTRDPLATVLLTTLGAVLAAGVTLLLGRWLGPGDPEAALRHAKVGAGVPVRLDVSAHSVMLVWPTAALIGVLLVLFGTGRPRAERPSEPAPADPAAAGEGATR